MPNVRISPETKHRLASIRSRSPDRHKSVNSTIEFLLSFFIKTAKNDDVGLEIKKAWRETMVREFVKGLESESLIHPFRDDEIIILAECLSQNWAKVLTLITSRYPRYKHILRGE